MKTALISLIALGAFTAAAAADPADRAATSGPTVLSAEQLDGVTAGIALLLPAVQQAREAAKSPPPQDGLLVYFAEGHPAQPVGEVRIFSADPGFELRPPTPALSGER